MMGKTVERPLPSPVQPYFQPYFEGLAQERIVIPQCSHCGAKQWPPRQICGSCQSIEFEWVQMPQEGTIYTYTIVYRAFHPWFAEQTPYGIVVGDLGAGVRIMGNYFGPNVEQLACGLPVTADFVRADDLTVLEWQLGSTSRA